VNQHQALHCAQSVLAPGGHWLSIQWSIC